jgi:hypothetical protein
MHDLDYVVELARAYSNALITRDELQDELHSCSIETIMFGGSRQSFRFVGSGSLRESSWIPIQRPVGCRKGVGALIGPTNA